MAKKIKPLKFRNAKNYDVETGRCYVGTVYDPIVDKLNEAIKQINHLTKIIESKIK